MGRKTGDFWLWNELMLCKSGAQKLWTQVLYSLRCCSNLEIIILTFRAIASPLLGFVAQLQCSAIHLTVWGFCCIIFLLHEQNQSHCLKNITREQIVLSNRSSPIWPPDLYQGPAFCFLFGQWPPPVWCGQVMLQGRAKSGSFGSPLCFFRLLQPCLLHGLSLWTPHSPFAFKEGPWGYGDFPLHDWIFGPAGQRYWTLYFPPWLLKANGPHGPTGPSQDLFSIGFVLKKPCPEMGLYGKKLRSYQVCLCPGH